MDTRNINQSNRTQYPTPPKPIRGRGRCKLDHNININHLITGADRTALLNGNRIVTNDNKFHSSRRREIGLPLLTTPERAKNSSFRVAEPLTRKVILVCPAGRFSPSQCDRRRAFPALKANKNLGLANEDY